MASYYPEGECFFVRSSLQYANNWSAQNREQFYSHVLLEYNWNEWVTINQQSRRHTRSVLQTGRGAWWNTLFGDWDRFYVGESKERSPDRMLAITSHPNSLNWNECRDLDSGGPRKYILRPVRIRHRETQWLWIDATIPLRAIYFPVCQTTDQAFQNFCTYVVIDFKARDEISIWNLTSMSSQRHRITRHAGLGWNDNITWGFKVPDIIAYLSIPHKLRNPNQGLYSTTPRGDELVVCASSTRTWSCPTGILRAQGFHREIDLARVLSSSFGVEVGWRPYQYSSFILNLVLHVVELGLGFIPGAGPLLSVAFGMGVQLLQDPEAFRAENILDLSAAMLETLIESSSKTRKYMAPDFLPSPSGTRRIVQAPLSEEERAERKKLGDELNARLTEKFEENMVVTSPLDQMILMQRFANGCSRSVEEPDGANLNAISIQVSAPNQEVAEATIRFK
ncbi:hypothetical protein NM208_g8955 [Fusarium decemcellulare]|uniref:Uncharacterized protein n=1 Tax=Fusarium decemcellulare TaxID=57161 RepID=A0ACC1S3H8_9HYPO|nr:hypothetical protein NM208_g8955 [Fusarium decemcellulare]